MSKLPHTHTDAILNAKIETLMNNFNELLTKAKSLGFDIKLWPDAKSLVLYYNDDYPNMLLVDKKLSCERETGDGTVISSMGGTE